MMRIAKPLLKLIEAFQKLPGIGPKTAQRLTYYLLHIPQSELDSFSEALKNLKKDTVLCSICKNVSESDPCPICLDGSRDSSTIMVVEQPLDAIAIERTGKYHGLYQILHGAISPLDNIGPDELYIRELFKRLTNGDGRQIQEIIIATNPTMEGDATAMYISKKLKAQISEINTSNPDVVGQQLNITRLGMGIPTGADLEYADESTLTQAIEGRKSI